MAGGKEVAGQTSVKSEPNVVPMIDIMLVLLIIFMIVTPLIAAGFKATLPKGKNLDPRPEGENEVVLGIDQAGRYFLNSGPSPTARSRTSSADLRGAHRGQDPVLQGGQQLKYGKMQEAVETARRAACASWPRSRSPRAGGLFAAEKKERSDMAGGAGTARGELVERAQRRSDDRHAAGAADHLHDHAAALADGAGRAGAAAG